MRLNSKNYFSRKADREYMSVSQFKQFELCEAAALAKIRGKYATKPTTALLVGSFVDAHFEGTLDLFKKNHPEIFRSDGKLKSDFEAALAIISKIGQQPLMTKLLSGEKQVIMTGRISGTDIKIKIDSLLPDMIVDLKIMRSFDPIYVEEKGRLPWYEAWQYDLQGAVYREIVRQNTGKILPFVLCAATKEEEPDVDALRIPDSLLDYELQRFAENITRYDAIKKGILKPDRCEKCCYCRKTKKIREIRNIEEEI